MPAPYTLLHRRKLLGGLTFGAAALYTPGVMAEALTQTPRQTEGPFYPSKLPLDTDNDLIVINDALTPAVGEITHLTGRVLSPSREPVRNAVVEIWQADSNGAYLHPRSANRESRDANFQGFGRFITSGSGEFYFRTIKPVPYTFRTPHIHFAVYQHGKRMLTTQMYIDGHPGNKRDRILQSIEDDRLRQQLLVPFKAVEKSTVGQWSANFEIVLGSTPEDKHARRASVRGSE